MGKHLVVGGSGYVGQELCRQLADAGEEVFIFGRSQPADASASVWLQGDIVRAESIGRALDGRRFDVIYHAASLPGDTGDPEQMMQVNLMGLLHMLVYARDTGAGRLVLSSSISAYEWYPATPFNPPDCLPVDETHPARPHDMYSSTKRMQEILALTFYRQYNLPVAILRLTAVVGPRGRGGGRSWRAFAEQLAEGRRVEIPHFSMDELCHYVDVRDVARMHILAGTHPRAVGEIFNCCGPAAVRGAEFAEIVQRLVPGIEVDTGYPWSMAQGHELAFDMTKASTLLDFQPWYTLEASIRHIKEWIDAGGLQDTRASAETSFGNGIQNS